MSATPRDPDSCRVRAVAPPGPAIREELARLASGAGRDDPAPSLRRPWPGWA